MTQRVVYDADGNAVPVVGLIDHLDAAAPLARLKQIAELVVEMRRADPLVRLDIMDKVYDLATGETEE